MRHEPRRISDKNYRCTCGSEFGSLDDADEHAANAREDEPVEQHDVKEKR